MIEIVLNIIAYGIVAIALFYAIVVGFLVLFYNPDGPSLGSKLLLPFVVGLIVWAIWHVFKLPIPHVTF
jgi:hypothetical protein